MYKRQKEITDADVENVVKSALTKSMTPDREVITFIPEEFTVDGFQGIRDPRGMMGIRLEMRGLLYTGPRTILHNLRKTVERAGLQVENIIISPLAMIKTVLNEGEREFGATVIDMGGGQTTVASVRSQELQFTNIYQEGGDYVTKDISKVLKTSQKLAEGLKFNYGEAYVPSAGNEVFHVEVIGEVEPVEVTEKYLAEIISARIKHIFEQIKQDLERRHLLDLPGGIVIIGGGAILPGVEELAQEVFGVNVKLFVPNQIGIRNPYLLAPMLEDNPPEFPFVALLVSGGHTQLISVTGIGQYELCLLYTSRITRISCMSAMNPECPHCAAAWKR